MTTLAILGVGGHASVVSEIALLTGYNKIDYYDDYVVNSNIVGNSQLLYDNVDKYSGVFVAIGDNSTRLEKLLELEKYEVNLAKLIHPAAIVSQSSLIETGSVVMAGAVISSNCHIGKGVIINTSASLDHDCMVKEGVHISPGVRIAGNVKLNSLAWVGIGATLINNIDIGSNAIVGAGSVVIHSVMESQIVVGVPAKEIKQL
ncbi:acetyltransferase [Vibrio sp. MACH09]|uniref:acetyltransferase n=1 Tax=Vibrio sp. MACH09 TaxID=3025122 RepID=UPI00278DBF1E|nr:acetyltransferase [Vibrio sp. MACH09]GLO59661.1 acetyltransferase [Vibrio sp. MACH09]